MGAVETLAGYADLKTIPWPSLDQAGHGFMVSDAYVELIQAERTRWRQASQALVPSLTNDEVIAAADNAKNAWTGVYDELERRASSVVAAITRGDVSVAFSDAVSLPVATLRATVIACSAMADAGALAHETGAVRFAVQSGEWSVERAEQDADQILAMYDALSTLAEGGTLDALKPPPVAGLGWIQALVVAVAVVTAIIVIAWLIITWREQSYVYDMRRNRCFDKDGNPRAPWPSDCQLYFDNLAKQPFGHLTAAFAPFTEGAKGFGASIGSALGWALGLTAMLYVGAVWILPAMERQR